MPDRKVWVVTQGGYDWSEVVGVFAKKEDADAEHGRLTADLKKTHEMNLGYGAGVEESVLHE